MTPDRELDVAARDDLAAQDRVTVAADTVCMVSGCHAGDVDLVWRRIPITWSSIVEDASVPAHCRWHRGLHMPLFASVRLDVIVEQQHQLSVVLWSQVSAQSVI